jgi:hypothetical protein
MRATILDTKTGRKAVSNGIRSYQWAENNYSCDCNRNLFGAEVDKPDNYCHGRERFIIIEAEMDSQDDYEYTLAELNEGYPIELLRSYGIK